MRYDVAIAGAGFGGLVAGALLAENGLKVALFDQHDKAGGFASHFTRKGFRFEVAVHMIEGLHPANFRSRIFRYLRVPERVDFLPVPELYALHLDEEIFRLPASMEGAEEALARRFPRERKGIREYFLSMRKILAEVAAYQDRVPAIDPANPLFLAFFPEIHRLGELSIARYLGSLFEDHELRWVILCNIGFFHHDPARYPAVFYLVNQAYFFAGGAWYVKGGMQNLSDALVRGIREKGGELFLRHRVDRVTLRGTRAAGLELSPLPGARPERSLRQVESDAVVCNLPLPLVYERMLDGRGPEEALCGRGFRPSRSATTLYMGLDQPFSRLREAAFFNFFRQTERSAPHRLQQGGVEFSLVDYSAVDRSADAGGKFTADLVYLDSFDHWSQFGSSDDYANEKIRVVDRLLARLDDLIPGFERHLRHFELGTPKTIERFTSNPRGAAYGFDPDSFATQAFLRRFNPRWRPVDSRVEDLYFASAWSCAHGINGVSLAGYQAARCLLERRGIALELPP